MVSCAGVREKEGGGSFEGEGRAAAEAEEKRRREVTFMMWISTQ